MHNTPTQFRLLLTPLMTIKEMYNAQLNFAYFTYPSGEGIILEGLRSEVV